MPSPDQVGPTPGPGPEADPASSSLPLDQAHILLSSFNSFLAVAIHNIIYYRNIYPPATFLATKAYNLPVHQNRHPKVCAWIRDAVDAVAVQLSSGHVSRVVIVIHSPTDPAVTARFQAKPSSSSNNNHSLSDYDSFPLPPSSSSNGAQPKPQPCAVLLSPGAVLERWLIDTSRFPAWPTPATGKPPPPAAATATATATAKAMRDFARVLARESRSEDARESHLAAAAGGDDASSLLRWPDLDEQLRGALRRMAATAEGMAPLPEGCGFTVAVELKEEGRAPIGHPQVWIPSEPNLQPASKGRDAPGADIGGVRTRPVRSVEAGPLFFECWVEEGRAKEVLMKMMEAEQSQSQQSTQPF